MANGKVTIQTLLVPWWKILAGVGVVLLFTFQAPQQARKLRLPVFDNVHGNILNDGYPEKERDFVTLTGFEHCSNLEGATVYAGLELLSSDGESLVVSESARDEVRLLLEAQALKVSIKPDFYDPWIQNMTEVSSSYRDNMQLRSACFHTALGNDEAFKVLVADGKSRLLRSLDNKHAMPFLQPTMLPTGRKPKVKVAYALMVHDKIKNIQKLVSAIASPDALILLHVDKSKGEDFFEEVKNQVVGTNVHVMEEQFYAYWGHVSLVWVTMRMFNEIGALCDYDYVVNLSGSDYPLKSTNTIHKSLERRPLNNWIWWIHSQSTGFRNTVVHQCRYHDVEEPDMRCNFYPIGSGLTRKFLDDLYPLRLKTSEWMILHQSYISYLSTAAKPSLLLHYMENSWCSDEMFFSTALMNSPYNALAVPDPKRLLRWPGHPSQHPKMFSIDDKDEILQNQHQFFIRKVDLTASPDLQAVLDEIRENEKISEEVIFNYPIDYVPSMAD